MDRLRVVFIFAYLRLVDLYFIMMSSRLKNFFCYDIVILVRFVCWRVVLSSITWHKSLPHLSHLDFWTSYVWIIYRLIFAVFRFLQHCTKAVFFRIFDVAHKREVLVIKALICVQGKSFQDQQSIQVYSKYNTSRRIHLSLWGVSRGYVTPIFFESLTFNHTVNENTCH